MIVAPQQSEDNHGTFHQGGHPAYVAVADPDAVQMVTDPRRSGEVLTHHFVSDAAGQEVTAAMRAYAAERLASEPDVACMVIWLTDSGTSPFDMLDDDGAKRDSAKDKAAFDLGTANGATGVGLIRIGWHATTRSWGADYVNNWRTRAFAEFGPAGSEEWTLETLFDLDWTRTRVGFSEVHRFDESAEAAWNEARTAIRSASSVDSRFLDGTGIAPVNYLNGDPDGAGGRDDLTHPSHTDEDGLTRFFRLRALDDMVFCGEIAIPDLTATLSVAADGTYGEWSVAGQTVTTERLLDGDAALSTATYAHWTEAMAIEIGGVPPSSATIVDGKVRFSHAAAYAGGEGSMLMPEGASGFQGGGNVETQDATGARTYKNIPVVDLGFGVPLAIQPSGAPVAMPVPGAAPDVTAPTLTAPSDEASGATGFAGTVDTDEAGGTLFWVATLTGTPTPNQIVAGQNSGGNPAAASGSQAVATAGTQEVAGAGLTAETFYRVHYAHRDAAGNLSARASADGFTTGAAGLTDDNPNPNLAATPYAFSDAAALMAAPAWGGDAAVVFNGDGTADTTTAAGRTFAVGTTQKYVPTVSGALYEFRFVLENPSGVSGGGIRLKAFARTSSGGAQGLVNGTGGTAIPISGEAEQEFLWTSDFVPDANRDRINLQFTQDATAPSGALRYRDFTVKQVDV